MVTLLTRQVTELGPLQRRMMIPSTAPMLAHASKSSQASVVELLGLLEKIGLVEDTRQQGIVIQQFCAGLSTVEQAWDALDRMETAGIEPRVLELCAASALIRPDAQSHSESWIRWARWVTVKAWREGRRFEAALLLTVLGDERRGDDIPSVRIMELAALVAGESDIGALFNALGGLSLDAADLECASLLAADATMRFGAVESAMVLKWSLETIDARLRSWLAPIYGYWERTGTRVPLADLHQRLEAKEAEAFARQARENALVAFRAAAARDFDFTVGKQTWGELFGVGKPMHPLLLALQESNHLAAAQWLQDRGDRDQEIAELMDRASERGTRVKHAGEYIEGRGRRVCLGLLRDVVRAAREWVQAQVALGPISGGAIDEAMRLRDDLRASQTDVEQLLAERIDQRHPGAPLLEDLVRMANPLVTFGA